MGGPGELVQYETLGVMGGWADIWRCCHGTGMGRDGRSPGSGVSEGECCADRDGRWGNKVPTAHNSSRTLGRRDLEVSFELRSSESKG